MTGHGLLPALGTVRRLRALVALGWPPAILRGRSGLAVECLLWAEDALVTPDVAARADALFEALSGPTRCPDPAVRAVAERLGWAPPLAWWERDLDDPAAKPNRGHGLRAGGVDDIAVERLVGGDRPAIVRSVDLAAAARVLVSRGMSNRDAGRVLGVTGRSVQRCRARTAVA